jgi:hypothetical protein
MRIMYVSYIYRWQRAAESTTSFGDTADSGISMIKEEAI